MPDGTVPGRSSEKKGVSGRSWLDTSVGAKADGNGIVSNSNARPHDRSFTAKRNSHCLEFPLTCCGVFLVAALSLRQIRQIVVKVDDLKNDR